METSPKLFDFTRNSVRTRKANGKHWFVLADICALLGYEDPERTVQQYCVNEDVTLAGQADHIEGKAGDAPDVEPVICVSESGFYALVLASKHPEARAFQQWITTTVLPRLRKYSAYIVGLDKLLENVDPSPEFFPRGSWSPMSPVWSLGNKLGEAETELAARPEDIDILVGPFVSKDGTTEIHAVLPYDPFPGLSRC